jgi:hypothetical protein
MFDCQRDLVISPAHRWCLEIELDDMGRHRTASLDFEDRSELEAQLARQLIRHSAYPFGRLLEFTNESGETLAVVASAYVSHTIVER